MPFLADYMDDRFVMLELYEGENQDLYREMLELYGYPAGPNQVSTLVPAIFVGRLSSRNHADQGLST